MSLSLLFGEHDSPSRVGSSPAVITSFACPHLGREMVQFHDRALIDGPARLTKEGHLVATARVARANNIQDYMPSEIGMEPKADGTPYRIFRPEAEVFAKDALSSAAHRPITIDHPKQDVSAENWKQL